MDVIYRYGSVTVSYVAVDPGAVMGNESESVFVMDPDHFSSDRSSIVGVPIFLWSNS